MEDVQVFIDTSRGKVILRAPYNPAIGPFINDLAGRWNQAKSQFEFPVSLAPHIENLAMAFFHTTGHAETCTVTIDASHWAETKMIELAGRILAERFSPSRRPKLGSGVVKVTGAWTWPQEFAGRSTLGPSDVILQATLPLSAVLQAQKIHPGLTITKTITAQDALAAEAERLEERLAVVYRELAA